MGTVRQGVFLPLEKIADELIFGSLRGVTSQKAKKDILTPWKEMDRKSREVMARSGTVDPAIRKGLFHRAANAAKPYLNSRDGIAPAYRLMTGTAAGSMSGTDDSSTETDETWD